MTQFYGSRVLLFSALDFGLMQGNTPEIREHNQNALRRAANVASANGSNKVYIHPGTWYTEDVNKYPNIVFAGETNAVLRDPNTVGSIAKVWDVAGELATFIGGDFKNLKTTVDGHTTSITQLKSDVANINTEIGDIGNLPQRVTTLESEMDTAQTDITSLKSSVVSGKTAIAGAISAKGVPTANDAAFQTMADNIGKINTSGGNYTASQFTRLNSQSPAYAYIGSNDAGTLPITKDVEALQVQSNDKSFVLLTGTWTIYTQAAKASGDKLVLYLKDKNGVTSDLFNYNYDGRGTNIGLSGSTYTTTVTRFFIDLNRKAASISMAQANGGSGNGFFATVNFPSNFDTTSMKVCFYVQKASPKGNGDIGIQLTSVTYDTIQ